MSWWLEVLRQLSEEGFLSGVRFSQTLGRRYNADVRAACVTVAGIDYLDSNSGIEKAKRFLKEIKEIVPGL